MEFKVSIVANNKVHKMKKKPETCVTSQIIEKNAADTPEAHAPVDASDALSLATKSTAPALTKGFAILNLIAKEPGLNLTAIKDRLGLPSSSCHHLVTTLCQLGALQQQPVQGGYILGLKLFELGTIAANQRRIEEFALPALKALAQELQLTCHLGVMEGSEAVYLLKVEGNSSIQVNTWVGKRLSLHSSSLGKVLLAWLPEQALEKKLSHIGWQTKTASTLTSPDAYRQHLIGVRQQGWAFDNEEDIVNIRCLAAPITDSSGQVIAAISAVGTVLDIDPAKLEWIIDPLCRTAAHISRQLGK